ncbi:hypothetical protein [Caballeronia sp. AZ10_KS36]|uniref:hypothetical protein n=1 Tax=Caballeronia sp. AZ10_KS36 TaxID=2921757 RepID=UPI002027EE25|nr:hypothetical protein [Caballeronia sp. AZ10_KS36]
MGIKVIAIAKGYYGQFREVGDEFEIADKQAFSDKWMERVDGQRTQRIAGVQNNSTGNNPLGGAGRDITSDLV